MTDRDRCDDSYEKAVEQAERMTRFGWAAIIGVTGLLGIAAIAVAMVCLVVGVALAYAMANMN